MSLTGIKDVDMNIILQLEDRELPRVCAVNKYVNEICESDAFWYRRLINRITKVRDDNLSKYKKLIIIDVTGERIREMQRFLGLKSLKELNVFLNELPSSAIYVAYYYLYKFNQNLQNTYKKFNENELPKYINKDELRYEMRRQVVKAQYSPGNNRNLNFPSFQIDITPFPTKLIPEVYDAYKSMGIIN